MEGLTGKVLTLGNYINGQNVAVFIGGIVVLGVIAGSYPALVLSGFNPVLILKGITRSSAGGANLRKALVVFQFTLSIALIAGTIIVYFQMDHVMDRDLGFDNEQMLVLDYNYDEQVNFKSEVLKIRAGKKIRQSSPVAICAEYSRKLLSACRY